MPQIKPFKISASITDFLPLFGSLEYVFKGLKLAGVDGIEIVMGVKSRWATSYLLSLVRTYGLPITTVHQPIWSGMGFYIDNNFVKIAKTLGATDIVCHPLPFFSYKSKVMRNYFKKLIFLQDAYGITVMLENMPRVWGIKMGNRSYPRFEESLYKMENLLEVANEFNFKITYDVSHGRYVKPQDEPWFEDIFPRLHNIHLSSFDAKHEHLPLFMGDFDASSFMNYLHQKHYTGHLTFEIFYPWFVTFRNYDFTMIERSLELIKSAQVEI